jgi:hypothetical protein
MSAARISSSGPRMGALTNNAVNGNTATVVLTPADAPATLVSTPVKADQTYGLEVSGNINSASATTTAQVIAQFTPTRTGVVQNVFTYTQGNIPTSSVGLRTFQRFWQAPEAGSLTLVLDNVGAQNLTATDVDAMIAAVNFGS